MGGNKNKALFGELTKREGEGGGALPERARTGSYLGQRSNRLAELASGEVEEKTLRWVDPARCRMWEHHNRRYELLNEQRCADVIAGLKAQGRQEFAAVVRAVTDDPNFDYEVICGARRHWSVSWLRHNNYPEFKFYIDVRDLTDEQAFRLSDIENRDRQDISDYERAVDYKSALTRYYKTQKQMAERLEVSEAWLSRYLDLADLPDAVVQAYPDVTQITVQQARELKPLLKDSKTREKVLKKAEELKRQQDKARVGEGTLLQGPQVVRALKEAATKRAPKNDNGVLAEYTAASGRSMLTVVRQGKKGLVLQIAPGSGASKEELKEACWKAIQEFAP